MTFYLFLGCSKGSCIFDCQMGIVPDICCIPAETFSFCSCFGILVLKSAGRGSKSSVCIHNKPGFKISGTVFN